MQSPSLELVSRSHISISGDVVIDPSAAIAPGVLLQADPGCRLTIAAGVCIGQGVLLHAHQGQLTIQSGSTLGSGVLIVGQGQVGENACIGAFTTILNSSIAADQIVPPRSLIGETGRQVVLESAELPTPDPVPDPWAAEPAPTVTPAPIPDFKAGFVSGFSAPGRSSQGSSSINVNVDVNVNGAAPPAEPPDNLTNDPINNLMSVPKPPTQVYGQAYVQRIMIAMFPHRRLIEKPPDNGSTPSNPPT